jgi:hypothetical protein
LIVAVVVIWLLFSGLFAGPSTTTNTVNPPAQSQPAQSQPAQSQPAQKDGPSVNINLPKVDVNTSGQQQPAAPAKP